MRYSYSHRCLFAIIYAGLFLGIPLYIKGPQAICTNALNFFSTGEQNMVLIENEMNMLLRPCGMEAKTSAETHESHVDSYQNSMPPRILGPHPLIRERPRPWKAQDGVQRSAGFSRAVIVCAFLLEISILVLLVPETHSLMDTDTA